jgi:hypothetical protein
MFCDFYSGLKAAEIPEESFGSCNRRVLHRRNNPQPSTLVASLWGCPVCGKRVRVFSRLEDMVFGAVPPECNMCGGPTAVLEALQDSIDCHPDALSL